VVPQVISDELNASKIEEIADKPNSFKEKPHQIKFEIKPMM